MREIGGHSVAFFTNYSLDTLHFLRWIRNEWSPGLSVSDYCGIANVCFYCLDSEPDYKMISDPSLKDLLQKLLIKDPSVRIKNVNGLRDHKYFEGINWRDIEDKIVKAPII